MTTCRWLGREGAFDAARQVSSIRGIVGKRRLGLEAKSAVLS